MPRINLVRAIRCPLVGLLLAALFGAAAGPSKGHLNTREGEQ